MLNFKDNLLKLISLAVAFIFFISNISYADVLRAPMSGTGRAAVFTRRTAAVVAAVGGGVAVWKFLKGLYNWGLIEDYKQEIVSNKDGAMGAKINFGSPYTLYRLKLETTTHPWINPYNEDKRHLERVEIRLLSKNGSWSEVVRVKYPRNGVITLNRDDFPIRYLRYEYKGLNDKSSPFDFNVPITAIEVFPESQNNGQQFRVIVKRIVDLRDFYVAPENRLRSSL